MIEILAKLVMMDMGLTQVFAETVLIKIVLFVLKFILLALNAQINTALTIKKIASAVRMNSVTIVQQIIQNVHFAKKTTV